jgi:ArsR family metal-binding transcriptional regulator
MLSIRKKCKINIYNSGKIVVITKDLNQVHEIAKELENVIDIGKK